MKNQRFTPILFLMILLLVACENKPKEITTIKKETTPVAEVRNEEPLKIVAKGFFSCLLNETNFTDVNAKMIVYQSSKEKIDSVKIAASQNEITMSMYVYLFDGVGNYEFKNNKAGKGIARGELIQMDGKKKEFFSTEGVVNLSSFDLDKKTGSGTFEAAYFYKSDLMPETFDVTKGSFSNLPIKIIVDTETL